jgi:hypothetical protein
MELEGGSSRVATGGWGDRRPASDGGASAIALACGFVTSGGVRLPGIGAHGSGHVGDHVDEDAGRATRTEGS